MTDVKARGRAILLSIGCLMAAVYGAAAEPAAPAPAAPAASTTPKPIDRSFVLLLLRSTLLALDDANRTGNYAVLHALASPSFQKVNTPAKLAEVFASFRRDKFDLSAAAVLDPQLAFEPKLEANGLLHIAGSFVGRPSPFQFDLMYQPVDGRWLLEAIAAGTPGSQDASKQGQAPAAAQTAATPPAQATPRQAQKPVAGPTLLTPPDKANAAATFRKPSLPPPPPKPDGLRRN